LERIAVGTKWVPIIFNGPRNMMLTSSLDAH
jgi:hypothetical protein